MTDSQTRSGSAPDGDLRPGGRPPVSPRPDEARNRYAAVWRWHFYAGLYTAPFLVVLALTGLMMLFGDELERWQFPELTRTEGASDVVPHQNRLESALAAMPESTFVRYEPGHLPGDSTRVSVLVAGEPHTVFVDGESGRVLGEVADLRRLPFLAEKIHGTLLVGDIGDRLIELAAGFGILLLVSGVYLWLPRSGKWRSGFALGAPTSRLKVRNAHKLIGLLLAPALFCYLVSGLAWTGIWGERLVQAWNSFPAEKWGPGGGGHNHEALNGESRKVVPWNLEKSPLPASDGHPGAGGSSSPVAQTLDQTIAIGRTNGIGARYFVGVPASRDDIWTVAQTAIGGQVTDPRQELTLHIDRKTGHVVGRAGWSEYALGAKAMAAGTPLHMGKLGPWNRALAAAVCCSVLLLAVTGPLVWWLRRPARAGRLGAPAAPARVPRAVLLATALLSLALPLVALALAVVALLDWAVLRRLPGLRATLD